MAFTFLKYLGYQIGKSLFDTEGYELVPDIIEKAESAEKDSNQILEYTKEAKKLEPDIKIDDYIKESMAILVDFINLTAKN